MGYQHKVTRVTLFGTMFGGAEEWSTGFFLGSPGGDAPAPSQAGADAIRDYWATFWGTPNAGVRNSWQFLGCKLSLLNEDGKTDLDNIVTSYTTAAVNGAGGGSPFPPQIALVATLVSGSGKGLAGKGRMYLPGIAHGVDGGGHIGTTEVGYVATALQTFLNAVNGSIDAQGTVINASAGRAAFAGIGAINRVVDSIRVGNVYDTQRRRRNQLAETYTSKEITL